MSITGFITSKLVQTAIYWGGPTNNGEGGYTFDAPVEILCRWEEVTEKVTDDKGEELLTRARVWVDQDLDEGGYLYLGDFDDSGLDSSPTDPLDVAGAWRIISFRKIPRLGSSTEFIRRANLNMAGGRTV